MEITQADDVEPERLHGREVLHGRVERSRCSDALCEPQMEMVDHRLIAAHRLEDVVVSEGQHRLASLLAAPAARVEVDRHLLPRARRRIEEGEVLDILRILFAIGLANAKAEPAGGILAIPDVPEVGFHLAREEEGMRRRERRQRAPAALGDQHAIRRLHGNDRLVLHAAELVALRVAARVVPRDTRHEIGREAVEPSLVLVCDPRFFVSWRRRPFGAGSCRYRP